MIVTCFLFLTALFHTCGTCLYQGLSLAPPLSEVVTSACVLCSFSLLQVRLQKPDLYSAEVQLSSCHCLALSVCMGLFIQCRY